jgi:hypothetical protein
MVNSMISTSVSADINAVLIRSITSIVENVIVPEDLLSFKELALNALMDILMININKNVRLMFALESINITVKQLDSVSVNLDMLKLEEFALIVHQDITMTVTLIAANASLDSNNQMASVNLFAP